MFRHELVRSLVVHYAKQAGYDGALRVYLNRDRFEHIRRHRREAVLVEHDDYAVTLTSPRRLPVTWVNAARHSTIRELADTAAHEAVHVADPGLRHGPEFRRRVRALLRGTY